MAKHITLTRAVKEMLVDLCGAEQYHESRLGIELQGLLDNGLIERTGKQSVRITRSGIDRLLASSLPPKVLKRVQQAQQRANDEPEAGS